LISGNPTEEKINFTTKYTMIREFIGLAQLTTNIWWF